MFKFNIIKILIQKTKQIKNQKKLFETSTTGDLIWAKMPLTKKELKEIEENHQVRPYSVTQRKNLYKKALKKQRK